MRWRTVYILLAVALLALGGVWMSVGHERPAQKGSQLDGKIIVGAAEWIWIDAARDHFQARIDTGAKTSSISAQEVTPFERDGKEWVRFTLSHKGLDDQIKLEAPVVRTVKVRQVSSHKIDHRLVVALSVQLGEIVKLTEFTLKDRSNMTYPVLLGREFLKDAALVDAGREYVQPKIHSKEEN